MKRLLYSSAFFSALLLLSPTATFADDPPPRDDGPPRREAPDERRPPRYTLGVRLSDVPDDVRDEFKAKSDADKAAAEAIREGKAGLIVDDVVDDSPADKAGIQEGDILVGTAAEPLSFHEPGDVLRVVNDSKGEEIEIILFRDGEKQSVKVKPDARRHELRPLAPGVERGMAEVERAIELLRKQAGDGHMLYLQPGKFIHLSPHEFPDDMTINIHKQGNQPADIEVKQGDKTWTAKENDLTKLPGDVRKHVEAMLARNMGSMGRFSIRLADPQGGPHPSVWRGRDDGPPNDDRGPGNRPPRPDDGERRPGRPPRPDEGPDDGADRGPGDRRPPPRPDGPPDRGPGPNGGPPPRGDGGPIERRVEELSRRMLEMHRQLEDLRHDLRDQGPPRRDERPE